MSTWRVKNEKKKMGLTSCWGSTWVKCKLWFALRAIIWSAAFSLSHSVPSSCQNQFHKVRFHGREVFLTCAQACVSSLLWMCMCYEGSLKAKVSSVKCCQEFKIWSNNCLKSTLHEQKMTFTHCGTLHHDLLNRGYLSLWFISCRNSIGAYGDLHEIEESVKIQDE